MVLLALVVVFHAQAWSRFDWKAHTMAQVADLPDMQGIKPYLLGYHHLAADVLWLRAVQVLGEDQPTAQDFQWLYQAIDAVTTLDPDDIEAYKFGGLVLTEVAHRVDLSNRLLEKGAQRHPREWWLPFNLAYNHFFYLDDPRQAAIYMAQAARLPGCPPYVAALATRLYTEAGTPGLALDLLHQLLPDIGDERVRARMVRRMKDVTVERDRAALQGAVADFHRRHGRHPRTLEELVERGMISAIPQEPFNGRYCLTPAGVVASSSRRGSLRVYRPGEQQQGVEDGGHVDVCL